MWQRTVSSLETKLFFLRICRITNLLETSNHILVEWNNQRRINKIRHSHVGYFLLVNMTEIWVSRLVHRLSTFKSHHSISYFPKIHINVILSSLYRFPTLTLPKNYCVGIPVYSILITHRDIDLSLLTAFSDKRFSNKITQSFVMRYLITHLIQCCG